MRLCDRIVTHDKKFQKKKKTLSICFILSELPTYQLVHLAIKVLRCLHKQTNVSLHDCTNSWGVKGSKDLPFFFLIIFFSPMNFHYIAKNASIFYLVLIINKGYNHLLTHPILLDPPPILIANLLLGVVCY